VAYQQETALEIFKEFRFEAAHQLTGLPAGHKCAHMHGHSYRVRVVLRGRTDARTGWIADFADIKGVCGPLIGRLDHAVLNEIEGLEQPTTENLACWLWRKLRPTLPLLARIEIWETDTCGAVYAGEDE
jgi:6-pyruvoyltetrahydropterin/6-carboxytetrahydropterin synthase